MPSGFWKGIRIASLLAAASLGARAIAVVSDDRPQWLTVASDSSYTISIDTTRIVRASRRTYEVWYRTDHAAMRFYKEQSFTRETVHAVLRCDDYSFRVISASMSVGSGRPVVRQTTERRELARQAWRPVDVGSTEANAARATCQVADWMSPERH